MNRKKEKMLLAGILAAAMVFTFSPANFANAEDVSTEAAGVRSDADGKAADNAFLGTADTVLPTGGYSPATFTYVGERKEADESGSAQNDSYGSRTFSYYSAGTTGRKNSSSDIFYNQLSTSEKALYNALDSECYKALNNTDTLPGYIEATFSNVDYEKACAIADVFRLQNPQYFFLANEFTYGYSGMTSFVNISTYPDFNNGAARQTAKTNYESAVNNYLSAINAAGSDYDKAKTAHDLIVKNLQYNLNAKYDQSSASALLTNNAVCIGYAETFALLMNRCGIEAITLTSSDHAWDAVKIDGYWYLVDCTFDDPIVNGITNPSGDDSNLNDTYFLKSSNTFDSADYAHDSRGEHAIDDSFQYFTVPQCLYDYPANPGSVQPETPGDNANGSLSGYTATGSTFINPNNSRTYEWYRRDSDGAMVLTVDGELDSDEFVCDGTYTYYCQADGTVMQDRLTYHPDGEHVIYFDINGHEVFNSFAHASNSVEGEPLPSDDQYYFNVFGYMYVNTVTYDVTGQKLYYIDSYGRLQHNGWFLFSPDAKYGDSGSYWTFTGSYLGCAQYDGSLLKDTEASYNGIPLYMQGNGEAAY